MKKVIVIGNNGVGKSVFVKKLGKTLGIPVIHLDNYFHKNDGSRLSDLEWDEKHLDLLKGSDWIIDGTYPRTLEKRIKVADTIIFLDYPKYLAFYSAIKRRITKKKKYLRRSYLRLLKKIIVFSRRKILVRLKKLKNDKRIVILSSRAEADRFLRKLSDCSMSKKY